MKQTLKLCEITRLKFITHSLSATHSTTTPVGGKGRWCGRLSQDPSTVLRQSSRGRGGFCGPREENLHILSLYTLFTLSSNYQTNNLKGNLCFLPGLLLKIFKISLKNKSNSNTQSSIFSNQIILKPS